MFSPINYMPTTNTRTYSPVIIYVPGTSQYNPVMSIPYTIPMQLSTQYQNVSFPSCLQPSISQDSVQTSSPNSVATSNLTDDLSNSQNSHLSDEDLALLTYFLGDDSQKELQSKLLPQSESPQSTYRTPSSALLESKILNTVVRSNDIFNDSVSPSQLNSVKKINTSVSCTCKKSGCNKLYCNCFRASLSCSGSCSCTSCLNTTVNVVTNSKKLQLKQQQMSKQSCQCRRTSCLKNYCACFNSGSDKLAVKRIVESYNKNMGK